MWWSKNNFGVRLPLHGVLESNSGDHACFASTIPTEAPSVRFRQGQGQLSKQAFVMLSDLPTWHFTGESRRGEAKPEASGNSRLASLTHTLPFPSPKSQVTQRRLSPGSSRSGRLCHCLSPHPPPPVPFPGPGNNTPSHSP